MKVTYNSNEEHTRIPIREIEPGTVFTGKIYSLVDEDYIREQVYLKLAAGALVRLPDLYLVSIKTDHVRDFQKLGMLTFEE